MNTLTIKNLSVKYNYGALAVSKFELRAEQGQIYTVVGDSESGKTSLLKCIAGLIAPIEGSIYLNEKELTKLKTKDKNVCMIYEDGCFFENRTVFYNLAYPLKIRKIDKVEIEKIIKDAIRWSGVAESLLKVKVKKISSDERFLLSIKRAYIREADIFLFDDPLKNLHERREEYFQLLKKLMVEKSKSAIVIYATTSGEECREIGGYCSFLNYGITIQRGTVEDLSENPLSVGTVGKFCPNGEILQGKIISEEGEVAVVVGDNRYIIDENKLLSDIFIGKECLVYFGNNLRIFDKRSERIIYSD